MRRIAFVLATLFGAIQLLPAGRTNPPVTGDLVAPAEVRAVLQRACYDCHSNETRWPWYAYVAPVSWRVVQHVDGGRNQLNFSHWSSYSEERRKYARQESFDLASDRSMPLRDYLRMHDEARLSDADIDVLRRWSAPSAESQP